GGVPGENMAGIDKDSGLRRETPFHTAAEMTEPLRAVGPLPAEPGKGIGRQRKPLDGITRFAQCVEQVRLVERVRVGFTPDAEILVEIVICRRAGAPGGLVRAISVPVGAVTEGINGKFFAGERRRAGRKIQMVR